MVTVLSRQYYKLHTLYYIVVTYRGVSYGTILVGTCMTPFHIVLPRECTCLSNIVSMTPMLPRPLLLLPCCWLLFRPWFFVDSQSGHLCCPCFASTTVLPQGWLYSGRFPCSSKRPCRDDSSSSCFPFLFRLPFVHLIVVRKNRLLRVIMSILVVLRSRRELL